MNLLKYFGLKACRGEAEVTGRRGANREVLTRVPGAGPGCCWVRAGQRCPGPCGAHNLVGETSGHHARECVVTPRGAHEQEKRLGGGSR